jgi:hypothetical protein
MSDPSYQQLLGYVLGALDDAEAETVAARLQDDPDFYAQWLELRRQVDQWQVPLAADEPPAGLAERTCRYVFAHGRPRSASPPAVLTPVTATAVGTGRTHWIDVMIAASVLAIAALALVPAVHSSRFQARLAACKDNLRQLGYALTGYSDRHSGVFPAVPAQGRLAAAGIYAPTLYSAGYLTETPRVICPDTSLAEQKDFRIPSLDELQAAPSTEVAQWRPRMGGSYGYCLGYLDDGVFRPTKNLRRSYFAVMADAPSGNLCNLQSDNHGKRGQNVLFEDGHVDFLTTTHAAAAGNDDIFVNDAHLVAAGLRRDDAVIAPSATAPIHWAVERR